MDGKNTKSRADCCNQLTAIVTELGADIVTRRSARPASKPSVCKQLAALSAERDAMLRKAALSALMAIYEQRGSQLWTLLGGADALPATQRDLISERMKYVDRELAQEGKQAGAVVCPHLLSVNMCAQQRELPSSRCSCAFLRGQRAAGHAGPDGARAEPLRDKLAAARRQRRARRRAPQRAADGAVCAAAPEATRRGAGTACRDRRQRLGPLARPRACGRGAASSATRITHSAGGDAGRRPRGGVSARDPGRSRRRRGDAGAGGGAGRGGGDADAVAPGRLHAELSRVDGDTAHQHVTRARTLPPSMPEHHGDCLSITVTVCPQLRRPPPSLSSAASLSCRLSRQGPVSPRRANARSECTRSKARPLKWRCAAILTTKGFDQKQATAVCSHASTT